MATKYVMFAVYDWEVHYFKFDTEEELNEQLNLEIESVAEDLDDEVERPDVSDWVAVEMFLCENVDDWHHLQVVEV
jgi:hypothetical protein